MGIRLDATDSLKRVAAGVVAVADTFSGCVWVKLKANVPNGGFATVFYANADAGQEFWGVEFVDGTPGGGVSNVAHLFDLAAGSESDITGPTVPLDTWYFFGWVRASDASRTMYYGTEAAGTLTAVGPETTNRAFANDIDEIWWGDDIYNEPCNCELAYGRLWNAALSQADLEAEMASATPVRTSGLRGDWRFTDAATAATDSSGNSLTLTVTGTLADAGNPTLPGSGPAAAVKDFIMGGLIPFARS